MRDIALVIGLLASAFPAVQYLGLFNKSIELYKSHKLHLGTSFDEVTTISQQTKGDLTWIVGNIDRFNGKPYKELGLSIENDARASSWGTSCNGVSAYGHWSSLESDNHISYLELLAAFFVLQSLFPMHKSTKHMGLKLGNTPEVESINHFRKYQISIFK